MTVSGRVGLSSYSNLYSYSRSQIEGVRVGEPPRILRSKVWVVGRGGLRTNPLQVMRSIWLKNKHELRGTYRLRLDRNGHLSMDTLTAPISSLLYRCMLDLNLGGHVWRRRRIER